MTSDDERYDRQLRLWGSHGQSKLSQSFVVCMGSSPVGTEVLKNLVLPGIGRFAVLDKAVVSERDLGVNFFVEKENVGQPRSAAVVNNLVELNPSVKGSISINSGEKCDVLVLCNEVCQIPEHIGYKYLVHVESKGFVGRVRIYASQPHVVLEPKSEEGRIDDYRISNPWPEFRKFCDSFDVSERAEEIEFVHIPWIVLLVKAVDILKQRNMELTRSNLKSALDQLRGGREGGQNFVEAIENIYRVTAVVCDEEIIDRIERIVNDYPNQVELIGILRKVVEFYHNGDKSLPLFGSSLPDMTSQTESYTRLMRLFREKFASDVARVAGTTTDQDFVRTVLSNIRNLDIIDFPEYTTDTTSSPTPKRHNSGDLEGFESEQQQNVVRMLDGRRNQVKDEKIIKEFERYEPDIELHTTSAVIGSVAAQEIVKLITNQFVPIDNSFVYNGIDGTAFIYKS
jgi:amyloid beta precursor protein binding protein 1